MGKTRSLVLKDERENLLKIAEKIGAIVEPIVNELGYKLYDIEFLKEYGNWELLITIDSDSGITLDDCEAVSRAVEPAIDAADPIEQAYCLTVSSVGLDRPLKIDKDFDRNIGRMIDVKLYAAPDDKALKGKLFTGELVSHDREEFVVRVDGKDYTFPKKAAALLRPHIDF